MYFFLTYGRGEISGFIMEQSTPKKMRGCHGCDRMVVGFMQVVPITTKVVSSNPAQTRCNWYNIMW